MEGRCGFYSSLNNVNWEVTYFTPINDIGDGKIDTKLKYISESSLNYNIAKLATIKFKGNDHDKIIQEIILLLSKMNLKKN